MRTGDWEQLVYYGILLAALLGGVLLTRRGQMGKTLRQFGLWALIFGGIVMAYGDMGGYFTQQHGILRAGK